MFTRKLKASFLLIITLTQLTGLGSRVALAQQVRKQFTVADEIGLALYDEIRFGQPVRFSPDGNYFAIYSERGRLDLDRVEGSLRFYASQDVKIFLKHSNDAHPPSPVWVITLSTGKEGSVINDWRWLADSSGVAFLVRSSSGNQQLALVDLRKRTFERLTSAMETIAAFDIRDRQHYVYTANDPVEGDLLRGDRQLPAIVGTGHTVWQLILPHSPWAKESVRSQLWAVIGSKRLLVRNNGIPVVPDGSLVLSPDGSSLIAKMVVSDIPSSWEALYPPPYASDPYRIHMGNSVHQYVRINLQTGLVQALTDAPISGDAGLWAGVFGGAGPVWSSDGRAVLLPGTFIKSKDSSPSRPCVAVVEFDSNRGTCVEMLKGRTETSLDPGYHFIAGIRFVSKPQQQVTVIYRNPSDWSLGTTEYNHAPDGSWQVTGQSDGEPDIGPVDLKVNIKQGFDNPPLFVATNGQTSRVIWDPNPQLKNIELQQTDIYKWRDKDGNNWRGALFTPSNHTSGRRYPLVIQTHGFFETEFRPSGVYPTAFAARALAAAGIVVLQVNEDCRGATPSEGPCAISGYESAVDQLVSEGLVDPERIGIVGFSRTCFYVMEMLTKGSVHLKAASITDGIVESYFQYMIHVDAYGNGLAREANSMVGLPPFGEGLQEWLKRSPSFNLDKINAPLMVVGMGPHSLLFMWEPYAGLRYLHKPVDLIMLNTDEHVLTNPDVRMASQGGSVDWFRYWLQDYEDPDPSKAAQYVRWRQLRNLQQ
jgi:hypothetical protein